MMICKGRLHWIMPLFLLSFLLCSIVASTTITPVARAQQNTANFLTYANTDLGFTIKYPSDWKSIVTKGSSGSNYVIFYSASDFSSGRNISTILVGVADTNATTLDELFSQYKSSDPERKILGESKTIMSGLPADKLITQSDASKRTTPTTVQFTLEDGKQYGISYNLGQPDNQQPIIQQMIDSFRITR